MRGRVASRCADPQRRSAFRVPRPLARGGIEYDGVDIAVRAGCRPAGAAEVGEGRYVASDDVLDELEGEDGSSSATARTNGSMRNIAGIASANGRVVGLMPHPEHATEALTGPSDDGLGLFYSALDQCCRVAVLVKLVR